jgi:hypothetical protein
MMQRNAQQVPWDTHDWKVKTLESLTAGGGSRLAFTCRGCRRRFSYTTANNRAWAVNDSGASLLDEITSRWLGERCVGRPTATDDDDRLHLKNAH